MNRSSGSDICSDCGGDNLVHDWRNGDVVCTGCGLVQYERLFDDYVRVGAFDCGGAEGCRDDCGDRDDYGANLGGGLDKPWLRDKIDREMIAFKNLIYEACSQDSDLSSEAWGLFSELKAGVGGVVKGRKRLALQAASVYNASMMLKRGYSTDFIIGLFGGGDIDIGLFYEHIGGGGDENETDTCCGIIKRMIYGVYELGDNTWKTYRFASELYKQVHDHPCVSSKCQTKKLLAVIVSIATRTVGGVDIAKKLGVSGATVAKIEGLIQKALAG